jgi:hemerythrin superfamily protein
MNAINLLLSQHREVDSLFSKITSAQAKNKKSQLFEELADKLAIHAAIEEHHFYPAVRAAPTKDVLLESVEEHLGIKRELADLLDMSADDERFDAGIKVLKEEVEHHVEEEEGDLFPKVRKFLDKDQLEAIGQAMSAEQAELEEQGAPRENVRFETDRPAPI